MSEKAFCPKHCRRWTYTSTVSFNYLERPDDRTKDNDQIYSKVHIFYGDFEYLQHNQIKAATVYLAFYELGNVVGFYWGMSVISFFHVLVYVSCYTYVWKKSRGEPRLHRPKAIRKRNQVHPA